jgi:predicted NAD/FAD-binding protein
MRIAVVGTGISGMLAARLLAEEHDVHVFEAGSYVGGHAHTADVEVGGKRYAADTGFMVFNDRTYPNFVRLLDSLGVKSRNSDMSFSVRCDRTGLEYQGGTLMGLFAQRRNLFRPSFHRMLRDILRFHREAPELLDTGDDSITLEDYLRDNHYSRQFVDQYLVPLGASIWSTPPGRFRQFPARHTVGFFQNHGLLRLTDRPQWKTIVGGAARYVEALMEPLADRVRLQCPVARVERRFDHVVVTPRNGEAEVFDSVVLAAHSDQTLDMLADPSPEEEEILGAIPYQTNEIVLHTDTRLLPRTRRAWASWNYHIAGSEEQTVTLTYNLSQLQGHRSAEPILETLNPAVPIDPTKVLDRMTYHHPIYSVQAMEAQRRYDEINGQRGTYYCGAYWGYGFHEDGVRSALAVVRCVAKAQESCIAAFT